MRRNKKYRVKTHLRKRLPPGGNIIKLRKRQKERMYLAKQKSVVKYIFLVKRHAEKTDGYTDTTSRPADTERQAQGLQSDASGCKGGKAYASGCKRMQAIKQRGRGKGERGKGQAGANLAKRRKRLKPWRFQRGVFISRGLMRQGSFALLARLPLLAPYAPFPLPLPLCFIGCIPLAFRSHYGFSSPLHSARIRFSCPSPAFLCRLVGWSCRWSAGRVGGRLVG